MKGLRKFIMSMFGLVCFAGILILGKGNIDPLSLGVGLGMVMAPTAAANAVEHMAKRGK